MQRATNVKENGLHLERFVFLAEGLFQVCGFLGGLVRLQISE